MTWCIDSLIHDSMWVCYGVGGIRFVCDSNADAADALCATELTLFKTTF